MDQENIKLLKLQKQKLEDELSDLEKIPFNPMADRQDRAKNKRKNELKMMIANIECKLKNEE